MSEDPQTTIANSFWNKINSKDTSIRKRWRGSGNLPGTERYPSPWGWHFLRAAPLLSWQVPAAMATYLLWDLETFYLHSLAAELDSPVFRNLPGYTQTWLSVSGVAKQLSFGLNRNPARAEGSGGVWDCVHHLLCVLGFRQKEVATGQQVFQSME